MAIIIRKVQSFRRGRKVGNYQWRVYKITKYGVCLIKFIMFGSLKTSVLEMNGNNMDIISDIPGFSDNQPTLLDGTGTDQP